MKLDSFNYIITIIKIRVKTLMPTAHVPKENGNISATCGVTTQ